ncbi:MAG: TetR/AcrR family transcriptional regulator [Myxococcales bacterium]|nr:TetR/AcrR family transcriptional regulator [Myxococcales bacterium]
MTERSDGRSDPSETPDPGPPKPLSKGERTKQKLVAATGELLRRQGFHATGLADIVDESGAPRGSLYFYFPGGKDELAIAALRAESARWRARIEAVVARAPDLGGAITGIIEVLAEDLRASKFQHGCPVAAVALETTSEPVRKTIAAHYAAWEAGIALHLEHHGIAAGPAKQLAVVALSTIEGALLLARVQRSTAPLTTVGVALRAMVAAVAPRAR